MAQKAKAIAQIENKQYLCSLKQVLYYICSSRRTKQ